MYRLCLRAVSTGCGPPSLNHWTKGAVTCAVCPESAWLVTFLIGNVSTGVVTLCALRCGAYDESGKKCRRPAVKDHSGVIRQIPVELYAAQYTPGNPFAHPVKYNAHLVIFMWKMSILTQLTDSYVLESISNRI